MVKVRFRCREIVKINFWIKMLFQGQQYMLRQEHINSAKSGRALHNLRISVLHLNWFI